MKMKLVTLIEENFEVGNIVVCQDYLGFNVQAPHAGYLPLTGREYYYASTFNNKRFGPPIMYIEKMTPLIVVSDIEHMIFVFWQHFMLAITKKHFMRCDIEV